MSKPRLEWKVGLFVLVCLGLLVLLLLQFSKGMTLFRSTYDIVLDAGNVGGLRVKAPVLMAGVQIGTVSSTELSRQGTNVAINLKIYSEYVVRDDALFKIETANFLGDQFVSIYAGEGKGTPLTNGSTTHVEEPFNIQEVARSAQGFIKRMNDLAKKVDDTVSDVRRLALNEKTLESLADSVENLRKVSEDALVAVDNVNILINTNGKPIGSTVSNLVALSLQLNGIAAQAQGILTTNSPEINGAVTNIRSAAATLNEILEHVQSGKGFAGALINNQQMADNLGNLSANLAMTTSNLNRLGFWHWMFYHPEEKESESEPKHKSRH